MQRTIAQALGLVIAGNARRAGVADAAAWRERSTFAFCQAVRFVDPGPRGLLRRRDVAVAGDPDRWLADRRGGGRLRIHAVPGGREGLPDRQGVGFVAGGPRWLIEVAGTSGSALWKGLWKVAHRDAPDRRIWTVTYLLLDRAAHPPAPAARTVAEVSADIAERLQEARGFAAGHAPSFAGSFERALAASSGRWRRSPPTIRSPAVITPISIRACSRFLRAGCSRR